MEMSHFHHLSILRLTKHYLFVSFVLLLILYLNKIFKLHYGIVFHLRSLCGSDLGFIVGRKLNWY